MFLAVYNRALLLGILALLYSFNASAQTVADPTNFTAFPVSSKRIHLLWTDNATNETNYQVRRGSTNLTPLGANTSSFADLALPAGLTPSTTYNYLLFAFISAGPSSNSVSASATTFPAPPGTPQNFRAVSVTTSQINLAWNATATATYYRIAKKKTSLPDPDPAFSFIPGDITTLSKAVTGLPSNTAYDFNLYAYNTGGASVTPAVLTNIATAAASPSPSPSPSASPGTGPSPASSAVPPGIVGNLPFVGHITDVVVDDVSHLAYVTTQEQALAIINVTNKNQPTIQGVLKPRSSALFGYYLAINGTPGTSTLAAIAGNDLKLIDISNPSNPTIKKTISGVSGYTRPAFYNNYLYAGSYVNQTTSSLRIIDVSNPDNPNLLPTTITLTGSNLPEIKVVYPKLYLSSGGYFYIYDIGGGGGSSPTNPIQIGKTSSNLLPPTTGWSVASGRFTLWNNYSYVYEGYTYITPVNIQTPSNPVPVVSPIANGGAYSAKALNNKLYTVTAQTSGGNTTGGLLKIFDLVASPSLSSLLSSTSSNTNPAYNAHVLDVQSTTAYLGWDGLAVVDVGNSGSPQVLSHIGKSVTVTDVSALGTLALVATGSSGLKIVNISNPRDPVLLYTILGNYTKAFLHSSTIAYAANATSSRIEVINLTSPSAPSITTPISAYPAGAVIKDVKTSGNKLYVLTNQGTTNSPLHTYDITNPSSPSAPTTVTTPIGTASSMAIYNGYVYIANGPSIQIVNPSNQLSPSPIVNPTSVVTVSGNRLYAISDMIYLKIYDLTNPAAPSLLNSGGYYIPTSGVSLTGITVSGNMAYIQAGQQVLLFDISDPSAVVATGEIPLVYGESSAIVAVGNYVYAGDSVSGLNTIISPPLPSSGFTATPISYSQINLSWPASPGALFYKVGYKKSTQNKHSWVYVTVFGTSLSLNALSQNTTYNLALYAYNEGGSQKGISTNATTLVNPNPVNPPVIIGQVIDPGIGNILDVAVNETAQVAFLASLEYGLVSVDVSNRLSPMVIGSIGQAFEGDFVVLNASKTLAAVTSPDAVRLINVTDPTALSVTNTVFGSVYSRPAFYNNYLYVGFNLNTSGNPLNGPSELRIYDVGNFGAPVRTIPFSGNLPQASVVGTKLHVVANNTFYTYELSGNPTNPTLVGNTSQLPLPSGGSSVFQGKFTVGLNHAYVFDLNLTNIVSLATPPTFVSPSRSLQMMGGVTWNNRLYAMIANSLSPRTLNIYDLVAAPTLASSLSSISENTNPAFAANGIDVKGTSPVTAYLGGLNKFSIADVTNASSVSVLSSIGDGASTAGDISTSGSLAVASGGKIGSLKIMDISTPSSPLLTKSVNGNFSKVTLSGNVAYSSKTSPVQLAVVNLANPASPVITTPVAAYPAGMQVFSMKASGSLFVLTNQGANYQLHIYGLSSPLTPSFVTSVSIPGTPTSMVALNNYAYIANGNSIQIVNSTGALQPSVSHTANGLAVWNGVLYSSDGANIRIYNIASPQAPTLTSTAPFSCTAGACHSLAINGNAAAISNGNQITLYDIGQANAAPTIGSVFLNSPSALASSGSNFFVTDSDYIMRVISH